MTWKKHSINERHNNLTKKIIMEKIIPERIREVAEKIYDIEC